MIKLIVGLGNPEPKYLLTPHNIGFMVIDALVTDSSFQKKHKSLIQKIKIGQEEVLLAKPQTYMNLSGTAVKEMVHFYKISLNHLLIIQDDIDQNFLNLKFQKGRGDGGHKGIRNIHQELQTSDYARLKLGVRPLNQDVLDTRHHVLNPFSKNDLPSLKRFLKQSQEAVRFFIQNDFEKSANSFNQR